MISGGSRIGLNREDYLESEIYDEMINLAGAIAKLDNMTDEFLDFYGITEGDNMYLAPEDRVTIW